MSIQQRRYLFAHHPRLYSRIVATMIVVIACWTTAPTATAARYRAGDLIQVQDFTGWLDGTVIKTNKEGAVMAEYDHFGGKRQAVFTAKQVRFRCEADAMSRARNWTDASGKFKIVAALLAIDRDKVSLRKTDMTEVTLTISKLSELDQSFLKRMEKEAPALARLLPAETFHVTSEPSGERQQKLADRLARFGQPQESAGPAQVTAALTPDPEPTSLKLLEAGVSFAADATFDHLGLVMPVGGKEGWLLASVESSNAALPTRLMWCTLASKKVVNRHFLPAGESVLDYHPPSHRLLTCSSIAKKGKMQDDENNQVALTLWEVLPTDKKPQPLVRWKSQGSNAHRFQAVWARLVDGDTVLHRWTDNEIIAWDVANKCELYRIRPESNSASEPVLTGNREYLFVAENKQVRIFAAANGELLSSLPAPEGSSAVAVRADGQKAAVLNSNQLVVWDLTDAEAPPKTYDASAIGTPYSASITWVGDDRLLVDAPDNSAVLFSLTHEASLWKYRFDREVVQGHERRRLHCIADGHLVYAVSGQSVRLDEDKTGRGFIVGAVMMPGPRVDEVALTLDRDSLLVLKPGGSVRLDVRVGPHQARVQKALEAEVAKNGWHISSTATAVLIAEMRLGAVQRVTFTGASIGEETVSVTPHISELRLEVNGVVAWQSFSSTGVPLHLFLAPGQTAQNEANRYNQPQPGFFDHQDLPEKILDPAKRHGVGVTNVSSHGLVPEEAAAE